MTVGDGEMGKRKDQRTEAAENEIGAEKIEKGRRTPGWDGMIWCSGCIRASDLENLGSILIFLSFLELLVLLKKNFGGTDA